MKNLLLVSLLVLTFIQPSFSAGSSTDTGGSKSNYDKALPFIKAGNKLEKKGKLEKAKKRYEKAITYLLKSNKENPDQPDTLNYLGFSYRKVGDYTMAEIYYLEGLNLDPNHKGINEYLGELYVQTKRIELAKERLSVLKGCNCEEYNELKEIIEGKKKSKY
tara:strand:+ start:277 stop:762 length:486 start_codon:yes stop_codon:yes gene_type:complete